MMLLCTYFPHVRLKLKCESEITHLKFPKSYMYIIVVIELRLNSNNICVEYFALSFNLKYTNQQAH